MHYVVVKPFKFMSVPYAIGDEIIGQAYTSVSMSTFFASFVVAVSDSGPSITNGNTSNSNSGGGDDVPLTAGTFNIPAGASTNGILSLVPVRFLDITNTDSLTQGADVRLFDANDPSQIPTAHCFGQWELGPTQTINLQRLTTVGLLFEIVQGSSGATALNSTGNGVDIGYASY